MTTSTLESRAVHPITRRFSVEEYERMAQSGLFDPDERLELLDGRIVHMSPIGPLHAAVVLRLNTLLNRLLVGRYLISVQNPIRLGAQSEPQPDVLMLHPRHDYYATAHPTPSEVLLVVEVADPTNSYDRSIKLPLYAAAGIAEVWLVALAQQQIEQYYHPIGDQYGSKQTYSRGACITAHGVSGLELEVDDILG
ncbi:Uma2 family endonuclease [Candidatus Viridilinea mediisalina]|uniref:Putative restriction endonuclease domain-containing protein n=1 Tax=Candidatus Viridilinea mediisalina TaxID=2024553 RepID=A0A2A6RE58_9CHLR|nr:Uma2 family endonuclease [Candidatus Viridilinea mediisalina]PDW00805.1 hypothetical protein CJ255_20210 [Candidatus Viridilinea mediisalina]